MKIKNPSLVSPLFVCLSFCAVSCASFIYWSPFQSLFQPILCRKYTILSGICNSPAWRGVLSGRKKHKSYPEDLLGYFSGNKSLTEKFCWRRKLRFSPPVSKDFFKKKSLFKYMEELYFSTLHSIPALYKYIYIFKSGRAKQPNMWWHCIHITDILDVLVLHCAITFVRLYGIVFFWSVSLPDVYGLEFL